MLVIRLQRTGRKGHAQFRVVVQDSRRTPTSGKVVALLGSFNPHTKTLTLNKEQAQVYLDHGAQPSDRVARLFKAEGVKLPAWVQLSGDKERTVRHPDKRRSTAPAPVEEPAAPAAEEPAPEAEAPAAEEAAAEPAEAEAPEAAPAEEAPAEEAATEEA